MHLNLSSQCSKYFHHDCFTAQYIVEIATGALGQGPGGESEVHEAADAIVARITEHNPLLEVKLLPSLLTYFECGLRGSLDCTPMTHSARIPRSNSNHWHDACF